MTSSQIFVDNDELDHLKKVANQTVEPDVYPHASTIEHNVVVYEGAVLNAEHSHEKRIEIMIELNRALSSGPGIIAITNAIPNTDIIDRATEIFKRIIEEEKDNAQGDHFAKEDAWNALQSHCLTDPENFVAYFGTPAIDLISSAWLGVGHHATSEMHAFFPEPTLHGVIAHRDMPLESSPIVYLPFSHQFHKKYKALDNPEFQAHFKENYVQFPLKKGDALFFNPAGVHATGAHTALDQHLLVNLLQISGDFGRSTEPVDRTAMLKSIYPVLENIEKTLERDAVLGACLRRVHSQPT